jgi:broad specificity phosphatase PhoE
MTEIYLIRHGQASFGQPAYDCLSSVGERQAELLGRHFANNGIRFDCIYSGALKRHLQTATIALRQMNGYNAKDIRINDGFNEFGDSDILMNRLTAVIEEDPDLSEQLAQIHTNHGAIRRIFDIAAKVDAIPRDEEVHLQRVKAFRDRIDGAIDNLVQHVGENKKVAVFTSGGPTAVALRKTLDTSREQTIRLGWEVRNTSVTVLRYDQEQLWLVLFNCVAHLESQNDPSLITYI